MSEKAAKNWSQCKKNGVFVLELQLTLPRLRSLTPIGILIMDDKQLDWTLPTIECDFNTMGLGGEGGCIYGFSRDALPLLKVGMKCIMYSFDGEDEITACEATVEPHEDGWKGVPGESFRFCGFKARTSEGAWYWGIAPWKN